MLTSRAEQSKPEPMIIDDDSVEDLSESSSVYGDDGDDPNDPVVADYDVYITERSENELFVLQFIGRPAEQHFTGASAPTELRIKPKSGYIEADVPMNIHQNYDRQKGVKFGEALRKTREFGQTTYGPAAGFERAMPRSTKRPGATTADDGDAEDAAPSNAIDNNDDNVEEYVKHFDDANEKGHVLNTVTWGGRIIPDEDWKPQYMVGAFRGKQLNLTPLDGVIQLRPELHHVDAISHLEAASRRREATEAKSVLPTVKKAEDQSLAEILKGPASEPWVKLRWNDSESEAAYEGFNKRLFLDDPENAPVIEYEGVAEYVECVLPMRVGRKKLDESIKLD
jgi:DNA-directed RNA polymerase-3 subunit RPC5